MTVRPGSSFGCAADFRTATSRTTMTTVSFGDAISYEPTWSVTWQSSGPAYRRRRSNVCGRCSRIAKGGLLNASSLARALETSAQSVTRYVDLLADLLLVRDYRHCALVRDYRHCTPTSADQVAESLCTRQWAGARAIGRPVPAGVGRPSGGGPQLGRLRGRNTAASVVVADIRVVLPHQRRCRGRLGHRAQRRRALGYRDQAFAKHESLARRSFACADRRGRWSTPEKVAIRYRRRWRESDCANLRRKLRSAMPYGSETSDQVRP